MRRKKNLARRTEGVSESGSGVAGGEGGAVGHPTAAADSIGADDTTVSDSGIPDAVEDLDGMSVLPAGDPTLGLTNLPGRPAEDWAANAGPTRTAEESKKAVSDELAKKSRAPSGRRITYKR